MKLLLIISLGLLVGCNVVLDVRKGGVSQTQSSCTAIENSSTLQEYCSNAAKLTNPKAQGSGTKDSPYILCSPYQLNVIADQADLMSAHFQLNNDLDMSCIAGNHTKIASSASVAFEGVFDGNGKKIKNWVYVAATEDNVGVLLKI
mgnify:CR=1 FL=1